AEMAAANPSAAMVDRLYLAFFQRYPDDEGWDHWIDARADGHRLEDIAEWFAESNEFTNRYGSSDFSFFLDQLYVDVLGRPPDAAGKAYWLDMLGRGEVTRGTVVVYFSESAEMLRLTRSRSELTIVRRALGQARPSDADVAAWDAKRASSDLQAAVSGLLAQQSERHGRGCFGVGRNSRSERSERLRGVYGRWSCCASRPRMFRRWPKLP
ncbi:MAG: DUF4214 domain-containing protein, partial [Acidimicrobiales bacterium]